MPPKPVRGPTRRTSALLPETQRANFLLEAASLLSQGSPQLAAILGRRALQVGDSNHAALPRGAAASLCARCGLPFSADVYQSGQVLKLPRHLVRRKLEAAARGGGKVGAQQQQQVNRAAVLYTCMLCGHVTVRPFYTLEAARQAIVKAGGTLQPAVASPGSMPATALAPALQQQQQPRQQVATGLATGTEAAQPGLEASSGPAAAAVGEAVAQEVQKVQSQLKEQQQEPERTAGGETSMQGEPSFAAAGDMAAVAAEVSAATSEAEELAAGPAHEEQGALLAAEGMLEAAAGEAIQPATVFEMARAADPASVHNQSERPAEEQQQQQQQDYVQKLGAADDGRPEQQARPGMPAHLPAVASPSAAGVAELPTLAESSLVPSASDMPVACEASGLASVPPGGEGAPLEAGAPTAAHVGQLPLAVAAALEQRQLPGTAVVSTQPLPPASTSPEGIELLAAEPAERPTTASEPPLYSSSNIAAPPSPTLGGKGGSQESSLGATTTTGVAIAATATPPPSSPSHNPPEEGRQEGLGVGQGRGGAEAGPDRAEGELGAPSSMQEPPRKRRRISWREELEDVQYIPAGPRCSMKTSQQEVAAEVLAELQQLLGSPASGPRSPLGAVRRQAWFRMGRAWKYGRV